MVHRVYGTLYEYIEAELPLLHEKVTQIRQDNPAFNNYHVYRAMVRLRLHIGYHTAIKRDGDIIADLKMMEEFLRAKQ